MTVCGPAASLSGRNGVVPTGAPSTLTSAQGRATIWRSPVASTTGAGVAAGALVAAGWAPSPLGSNVSRSGAVGAGTTGGVRVVLASCGEGSRARGGEVA